MAKPKAYLETTIVSYLAASPSRDIVIAAHQQLTRMVGAAQPVRLFISEAVVDEAARGDAAVAARGAAFLTGIPALDLAAEVYEVANSLVVARAVPANAVIDAIHFAVSAVNRVEYRSPGTAPTSPTRRCAVRLSTCAERPGWRRRLSAHPKSSWKDRPMSSDPIVDEVRAHRAAIAKEHGNDLKAIVAALRRKQGADGRRVVSLVAKRALAKPTRRKAG